MRVVRSSRLGNNFSFIGLVACEASVIKSISDVFADILLSKIGLAYYIGIYTR
jgi:hypothetical protein